MNQLSRWAVILPMIVTPATWAQEKEKASGETKAKIEDVRDGKNAVSGNIDEEITNAKLRAESGSKSKYSLSARANYTGGSFSRAFGVDRPNLAAEPGAQENTSASLGLDARYRMTKNDSVTVGTEFAMMTPFQGNVGETGTQLNVFDPIVAYNKAFAAWGLQQTASVQVSAGTSTESQGIDKNGNVTLSYNMLKELKNGVGVGLATDLGYNSYSSAPGKNTATARPGFYGGDRRTAWTVAFYPYAEYSINDRYSLRTVFGYFNFRHVYGDANSFRLLNQYRYQSAGVGIAVTRDVYLYPNVQFVPDNIRSDFTNIALNATVNMF